MRSKCVEYGKLKSYLCCVSGESPHFYTLGFPWVELFQFIEQKKIKIKGNLGLSIAQDFVKLFSSSNTT